MKVPYDVIESAAALIQDALKDGLPVEEEAEWRRFDEVNTQALKAVLEELSAGDLAAAVRAAADRLAEPVSEGGAG